MVAGSHLFVAVNARSVAVKLFGSWTSVWWFRPDRPMSAAVYLMLADVIRSTRRQPRRVAVHPACFDVRTTEHQPTARSFQGRGETTATSQLMLPLMALLGSTTPLWHDAARAMLDRMMFTWQTMTASILWLRLHSYTPQRWSR